MQITRSYDPSGPVPPAGSNARLAPPLAASASLASRAAGLAYGLVAYAIFLTTFLYAIGFVSGLLAPTTVDAGRPAPIAGALLVNGGLLALFAVQHTIMARRAFKRRWTRIVPAHLERSTFVLAACAILGALYWQWRELPGALWDVRGPAAWILRAASFLGWGTVLYATFLIDHFELFGVRQVVRHYARKAPAPARFRERSLYRLVRHPLMLGFLLAFWATPAMSAGHFFFAATCTAYIVFGIHVEERSLVAEHGRAYLDYRARVPMLLPLPRPRVRRGPSAPR